VKLGSRQWKAWAIGIAGVLLLGAFAFIVHTRVNFGRYNPLAPPARINLNGQRYYPDPDGAALKLEHANLRETDLVVVETGLPPAVAYLVGPDDVHDETRAAVYVRTIDGALYVYSPPEGFGGP